MSTAKNKRAPAKPRELKIEDLPTAWQKPITVELTFTGGKCIAEYHPLEVINSHRFIFKGRAISTTSYKTFYADASSINMESDTPEQYMKHYAEELRRDTEQTDSKATRRENKRDPNQRGCIACGHMQHVNRGKGFAMTSTCSGNLGTCQCTIPQFEKGA